MAKGPQFDCELYRMNHRQFVVTRNSCDEHQTKQCVSLSAPIIYTNYWLLFDGASDELGESRHAPAIRKPMELSSKSPNIEGYPRNLRSRITNVT